MYYENMTKFIMIHVGFIIQLFVKNDSIIYRLHRCKFAFEFDPICTMYIAVVNVFNKSDLWNLDIFVFCYSEASSCVICYSCQCHNIWCACKTYYGIPLDVTF